MKYLLIVVGVVIAIIFGIVLIFGGDSKDQSAQQKEQINLSSYATNTSSSLQLVAEGPINAQENHRTVTISVTPNQRTITILQGYNNTIIKQQVLDNSTQAYSAFLDALNRVGFTSERNVSNKNSSSICPTGNRYNYQLNNAGNYVINNWSATCTPGTYGGDATTTRSLFQAQIPNYSQFMSGQSFVF